MASNEVPGDSDGGDSESPRISLVDSSVDSDDESFDADNDGDGGFRVQRRSSFGPDDPMSTRSLPDGQRVNDWHKKGGDDHDVISMPKSECVLYRQIRALLFAAWHHRIVRGRAESEWSIAFVILRTSPSRIGL